MSTLKPFSLRIFVADGDPDGLRVVERSNWVGKAIVFPRALLPKIKQRAELGQLACICCWGRARHAAKRLPLDNANQPAEPSLSEADCADMQVFLENMLGMLPVLGIHAFEQTAPLAAAVEDALLSCKGKGVSASGYEATQGFVVKAGSLAVGESVPSMQQHVRGMFDLRALNLMIGGTAELLSEALVLAEENGIGRRQVLEVMAGSAIGSPFVRYKTEPLVADDYTPTFTARLLAKDLGLALDCGRAVGVPLPITEATEGLVQDAIARGLGEDDLMVLLPRLRQAAGLDA